MFTVPLNAKPSQTLNITLSGQVCTLNVYQKFYGLFMDVLVANNPIIQGVLCHNANYIVRSIYLGFFGDFTFWDMQGLNDPVYTGLGGATARYQLLYFAPTDLPPNYGLTR